MNQTEKLAKLRGEEQPAAFESVRVYGIRMSRAEADLNRAIKKACSIEEAAPKRKHVRACIVYTWDHHSARAFFQELKAQPLASDEVQLFKSLILLHKVVQEGHKSALVDAIKNREWIRSLARVHQGGSAYERLISEYVRFLVTKLDFHANHRGFKSGTFEYEEYTSLVSVSDPNQGYETILDLLDLQDSLDHFAQVIFASLGKRNDECKTSALVPLISESYGIYKFVTSMLRAIHSQLDSDDVLESLKEKVKESHARLFEFYADCSSIKFLSSLVTIPKLPRDPPPLEPRLDDVKPASVRLSPSPRPSSSRRQSSPLQRSLTTSSPAVANRARSSTSPTHVERNVTSNVFSEFSASPAPPISGPVAPVVTGPVAPLITGPIAPLTTGPMAPTVTGTMPAMIPTVTSAPALNTIAPTNNTFITANNTGNPYITANTTGNIYGATDIFGNPTTSVAPQTSFMNTNVTGGLNTFMNTGGANQNAMSVQPLPAQPTGFQAPLQTGGQTPFNQSSELLKQVKEDQALLEQYDQKVQQYEQEIASVKRDLEVKNEELQSLQGKYDSLAKLYSQLRQEHLKILPLAKSSNDASNASASTQQSLNSILQGSMTSLQVRPSIEAASRAATDLASHMNNFILAQGDLNSVAYASTAFSSAVSSLCATHHSPDAAQRCAYQAQQYIQTLSSTNLSPMTAEAKTDAVINANIDMQRALQQL